jgi:penicillin amidase
LALACFWIGIQAQGAPAASYGSIEILRDRWGVPNVLSDTDEGAMYGLGYATAEDRLYQMNFHLRLMQGRLAEVVGDLPKRVKRSVPPNSALEEDRLMRTLGYYRHAQAVAANLDPETQKLLQAYSDGVNDYVQEHGSGLHPLFAEQGWKTEPWTPADCIVSWWQLARFFAADGLRDLFTLHQNQRSRREGMRPVIDDEAAVVRREDVSEEWVRKVQSFAQEHGIERNAGEADGPKFSHAWVVGGKKTTTGSAVLVSDPQTPVWNPSALYEFHIEGKTFNARGAGVAGSPLILIGYNRDVAWGMSALGADQADLFMLHTDASRPGHYRVDGEWLEMQTREETIKTKGAASEKIVIKETIFGPVVSGHSLDRRPGEEVALRRVPLGELNRDTVQGAIRMLRARNAAEFLSALADWRFPTANCIFGDRSGDIGYSTIGAIPVRGRSSPGPNAIQDGSSRTNDWRMYVPAELLPQVMNPKAGHLVTANHRSIQSFYPLALGDSTGSSGETDRGWRIKQRLAEFLEESEKFTPADVRAIQDDSVNAVKKEMLRIGYHLRDGQKVELAPSALKTLDYLERWHANGAASHIDNPGTELANLIPTFFRQTVVPLATRHGGGTSGLVLALKTLGNKVNRGAGATLDADEIEFIEATLAEAWDAAEETYGSDASQWRSRALAAGAQRMGYMESLAGYPSLKKEWDVARPRLQVYDGSTILAQPGQSYTQFVPLHDLDSAETILPLGTSERPESPFRFSTYGDWAGGRLHPAPLSRAAVEKITVHTKVLSATARMERSAIQFVGPYVGFCPRGPALSVEIMPDFGKQQGVVQSKSCLGREMKIPCGG